MDSELSLNPYQSSTLKKILKVHLRIIHLCHLKCFNSVVTQYNVDGETLEWHFVTHITSLRFHRKEGRNFSADPMEPFEFEKKQKQTKIRKTSRLHNARVLQDTPPPPKKKYLSKLPLQA